MKLGSLFSGSGGFELAGVINGIESVWDSEIEPYPMRVTAARFPECQQLGDVTKIRGNEIEAVDVITFGSPCQDLSVAGLQKGIHRGERSSLFFEAVRIIKEMRERDKSAGRTDIHIRPRYAVWENVPGAFSSNGGEDFRAVLQALCEVEGSGVSVPGPEKGKWKNAGCIVGDSFSIAWRVYDAQFWGVPQRRKRIYLVADFGSERAGEILFERESVRGNPATGGEARQGAAADPEGSAGGSGPVGCDLYNGSITGDRAAALNANTGASANHAGPSVCYSIQGHVVDRETSQNGCGYAENYAHALNATDRNIVCFAPNGSNCGDFEETETAATMLTKYHYGSGGDAALVASYSGNEIAATLDASYYKGTGSRNGKEREFIAEKSAGTRKYIVRRLTPLECCRLQGFPDWWTDGVEGSDSAVYKMWGNGIALPCAADVLRRIAEAQ